MSNRVKILIQERKVNREKLETLENELKLLSDKLFLTKQLHQTLLQEQLHQMVVLLDKKVGIQQTLI